MLYTCIFTGILAFLSAWRSMALCAKQRPQKVDDLCCIVPRGHMAGGPNYGWLAAEPQSAKGRDT